MWYLSRLQNHSETHTELFSTTKWELWRLKFFFVFVQFVWVWLSLYMELGDRRDTLIFMNNPNNNEENNSKWLSVWQKRKNDQLQRISLVLDDDKNMHAIVTTRIQDHWGWQKKTAHIHSSLFLDRRLQWILHSLKFSLSRIPIPSRWEFRVFCTFWNGNFRVVNLQLGIESHRRVLVFCVFILIHELRPRASDWGLMSEHWEWRNSTARQKVRKKHRK